MRERKVFLVSCTKSKRAEPMAARELYCASDWFAKARAYVEAHGADVEWYILSAEHGLVHPDEVIAPYETTLLHMAAPERKAWAQRVWSQLCDRKVGCRGFIFLAGELYREHLERWATLDGRDLHGAEVPMRGLGIGEQKAWLASAKVLPLDVDDEWSLRSSWGDGDLDISSQELNELNVAWLQASKGPAKQKAHAKLQTALKRHAKLKAGFTPNWSQPEPLPVDADPFVQATRDNAIGQKLHELAEEIRRRDARRDHRPLPAGSLFDEVTRNQLELF